MVLVNVWPFLRYPSIVDKSVTRGLGRDQIPLHQSRITLAKLLQQGLQRFSTMVASFASISSLAVRMASTSSSVRVRRAAG